MSLGEKIKSLRNEKSLTQKQLAGDKITRNMLSLIESDKGNPSLDTLKYIAEGLGVPVAYLLSENDEYFLLEKSALIDKIYEAYRHKSYSACINFISKLSKYDDELYYLLTLSHFELGKINVFKGSLLSAKNNLNKALSYAEKTIYDTKSIECIAPMYLSVAENVQAPLLEFAPETYLKGLDAAYDFEFYKYLTHEYRYEFKNSLFQKHIKAKELIKSKKYTEAKEILLSAVEENMQGGYNAFVIFGIYADLELCYKELMDFENAYRYSTKRLSLLEGFKT